MSWEHFRRNQQLAKLISMPTITVPSVKFARRSVSPSPQPRSKTRATFSGIIGQVLLPCLIWPIGQGLPGGQMIFLTELPFRTRASLPHGSELRPDATETGFEASIDNTRPHRDTWKTPRAWTYGPFPSVAKRTGPPHC
jgi:hypothetical protein